MRFLRVHPQRLIAALSRGSQEVFALLFRLASQPALGQFKVWGSQVALSAGIIFRQGLERENSKRFTKSRDGAIEVGFLVAHSGQAAVCVAEVVLDPGMPQTVPMACKEKDWELVADEFAAAVG
jgi:hypothetical protein